MFKSVIRERPFPPPEAFCQHSETDLYTRAVRCEARWRESLRKEYCYRWVLNVTSSNGACISDESEFSRMIADDVSSEIAESDDYPSTYEQFKSHYDLARDVFKGDGIRLFDYRVDAPEVCYVRDWSNEKPILLLNSSKYIYRSNDVLLYLLSLKHHRDFRNLPLAIALVLALPNMILSPDAFSARNGRSGWKGSTNELVKALNDVVPLSTSIPSEVQDRLDDLSKRRLFSLDAALLPLLQLDSGKDHGCFRYRLLDCEPLLKRYKIRIELGDSIPYWGWERSDILRRNVRALRTKKMWTITSSFRPSVEMGNKDAFFNKLLRDLDDLSST